MASSRSAVAITEASTVPSGRSRHSATSSAMRIGSLACSGSTAKFAAGEIAEEANLSLPAQSGLDQVGDLGDDEHGDDERSRMRLQQLQAGGVVGVVGIDVGVERASVDDQRDGTYSEARISSIHSETSSPPPRPLAAH